MPWRWLGLLSLVGMLACAGLEDNDSAPRCSATEPCSDALTCYRNFCVEAAEASDAGSGASKTDAGGSNAATVPADAAKPDAAKPAVDAGAPTAVTDAGAPASATPPTVAPPADTPASSKPGNGNNGRFRYPWGLDQITNLPPYLIGCLGSCTIAGKKECETCVAEKERQRGSESELICHRSDDEDDDGCGAAR